MAKSKPGSVNKEKIPIKRGQGPIYAEIAPDLRKEFYDLSQKYTFREKDALEKLIRYLIDLEKDGQLLSFLKGESHPIQSLARAIELIQWGQHSFTKKRWEWCAKVHLSLLKECTKIVEIRRFALYRISYSFISLADGMKKEILEKIAGADYGDLEDRHRAIDTALMAGQYFGEEALKHGELSVARYNIACSLSLIAENKALRAIPWNSSSTWVVRLKKEIAGWLSEVKTDTETSDDETVKHRWWKTFGAGWRAIVESTKENSSNVTDLVDPKLKAARDQLNQMVVRSGDSIIPSDAGELVLWCSTDLDLAFLRNDSISKFEYEKWEKDNKPTTSRLATFDELWQSLPNSEDILKGFRESDTNENKQM